MFVKFVNNGHILITDNVQKLKKLMLIILIILNVCIPKINNIVIYVFLDIFFKIFMKLILIKLYNVIVNNKIMIVFFIIMIINVYCVLMDI